MPQLSDFTRRTLRIWAWIAGLHSLVLIMTASMLVPWKTPWVNGACIAYGVLQGAVAVGLWQRAVWGWRLGLLSGLLGLASGVVVVSGLLLSWAYLRGIYGPLGYGAAIMSLLCAGVAFQVLSLVAALQLRALLRREVRQDLRPAKAVRGVVVLLLCGPLALIPPLYLRARLTPVAAVTTAVREQSVAVLRAALLHSARPLAPVLSGVPLGPGPLYVSLWQDGQLIVRVRGQGSDFAAAVDDAASALRAHPALATSVHTAARLKVDRVSAVGVMVSEVLPLIALSVVPGQDGLRRRDSTEEKVLLPDDMIRADRFGQVPLLPGLREVRLGLDASWALAQLRGPKGALERLRLESWVESARGVVAVIRGYTPTTAPKPEDFQVAAIRAGAFLMRQQRPDGAFHYRYDALDHRHSGTSRRSLARHAGVIYGLSQLYARTHDERLARSAAQAIRWLLNGYSRPCGAARRCLVQGRQAELGPAALTLIALLAYQRATADDVLSLAARELAEFVLAMQRADGEFHHAYHVQQQQPIPAPRLMFASEQAALALVMAHEAFGEPRYLQGAERALDFLTGAKYAYFVGWFSYGADHWTCIAAEEAWPRLRSRHYLDFCRGYAAFIRRIQYGTAVPAFAGYYGFSYLLVPQAPAAAGFTEAVISIYKLSLHHGRRDAGLHAQVWMALEALRRDQLRDDNSYLATSPSEARGGIRRSVVQQDVRIDFTQHALSALIRGAYLDP
jgi:hypothetical protein